MDISKFGFNYQQYTQFFSGTTGKTSDAFNQIQQQILAQAKQNAAASSSTTEADAAAESAAAEQQPKTLEEFKKDFYEYINSIPLHPSQQNARHSISISDQAFQKMMDDPEYKAEVEYILEREMGANFAVPPAFTTMTWDANGEYSGTAGGSAHMDKFETLSSDAFWKREPGTDEASKRADKRKEIDKLLEELLARRQQQLSDLRDNFFGLMGDTAKTGYSGKNAFSFLENGPFTSLM